MYSSNISLSIYIRQTKTFSVLKFFIYSAQFKETTCHNGRSLQYISCSTLFYIQPLFLNFSSSLRLCMCCKHRTKKTKCSPFIFLVIFAYFDSHEKVCSQTSVSTCLRKRKGMTESIRRARTTVINLL